jgi:hypothetical protein
MNEVINIQQRLNDNTTSVKSVVSYLDDGEIKNVIFDKELHKIVD